MCIPGDEIQEASGPLAGGARGMSPPLQPHVPHLSSRDGDRTCLQAREHLHASKSPVPADNTGLVRGWQDTVETPESRDAHGESGSCELQGRGLSCLTPEALHVSVSARTGLPHLHLSFLLQQPEWRLLPIPAWTLDSPPVGLKTAPQESLWSPLPLCPQAPCICPAVPQGSAPARHLSRWSFVLCLRGCLLGVVLQPVLGTHSLRPCGSRQGWKCAPQ